MRIAALIKQIPAFEAMTLGADGRLVREGLALEMNAYCRRAVSKAVELASKSGGLVVVVTMGPLEAEDVLREAVAWADARAVPARGVLVSDRVFAGSDTLATARALAATLEHEGPFDLIMTGRNSVDADTGQVGPELAQLLDLPFATGVRHLTIADGILNARCEHDDGWVQLETALPAVVSTAERLCEPCKVDPDGRVAVDGAQLTKIGAADLGSGPWGQAGSQTCVGATRVHEVDRAGAFDAAAPLDVQVRRAVEHLKSRGALQVITNERAGEPVPPAAADSVPIAVVVVVEPQRPRLTRELLGTAAALAQRRGGSVVAVVSEEPDAEQLGAWGADAVRWLRSPTVEEDVAGAVVADAKPEAPWVMLAPSTAWGREVASRIAAALSAGLTGDATELEVDDDGRLVAWKPAFGGALVAAVVASSPIQMATVRAGVLPVLEPRQHRARIVERPVEERGRVKVLARTRDDDIDVLADADVVIGVGQAIEPSAYGTLEPLRQLLGAELAATRKVTDLGWMPRARQVGITGRSIAPRLYVAFGVGGNFNHSAGIRAAGTVLAVNHDPSAPIFGFADIGIVGDWREAVALLAAELPCRA